jgi:hypothetical protein
MGVGIMTAVNIVKISLYSTCCNIYTLMLAHLNNKHIRKFLL